MSAGDVLYTPGKPGSDYPVRHVMIYVQRNGDKIIVIHASSGRCRVVRDEYTLQQLRNEWGFNPYRLKYDVTPPEITITANGKEMVDGQEFYDAYVTINYEVKDDIDLNPCGKCYLNDKLIIHHRKGSTTVKKFGKHTIKVEGEDWASNLYSKTIN